jgi:hypothetical protein
MGWLTHKPEAFDVEHTDALFSSTRMEASASSMSGCPTSVADFQSL